jgi:hypothetical protein
MPKTSKNQIGTPAPASLKARWEAECIRLKNEVGLTFRGRTVYPGNLQLALLARFLALADPDERVAIASQGLNELAKYPEEDSSAGGGARSPRTGTPQRIGIRS